VKFQASVVDQCHDLLAKRSRTNSCEQVDDT